MTIWMHEIECWVTRKPINLPFLVNRVKGLIQSGAMKVDDKPIWYEVYEAFPPKIEPNFGRKDPDIPIRQILYPEDVIRA